MGSDDSAIDAYEQRAPPAAPRAKPSLSKPSAPTTPHLRDLEKLAERRGGVGREGLARAVKESVGEVCVGRLVVVVVVDESVGLVGGV